MAIPTMASVLVNDLNDNTVPAEETFSATYDSIVAYNDTYNKLNFEQLIADLFTAGYDYTNDGVAQYATPLEDQMVKLEVDEEISGAKTFTGATVFEETVDSSSTFSSSGQPRCRAFLSANQAIATANPTGITFTNEEFDVAGLFSPSGTRITIPSGGGGAYIFQAQINFAANATGVRRISLYKNAAEIACSNATDADGTEETFLQVSYIDQAVANDYYEVYAYQNSGGNLNVLGNAGGTLTFFSAMKCW